MGYGFEVFNAQGVKSFDHNSLTAKFRGIYVSPKWWNWSTHSGSIYINKLPNETIFYYPSIMEVFGSGERSFSSSISVSISDDTLNWVFTSGTWGGSFTLIYGVF